MPVARLIIDPPAPGPWNMAVDEALLRTAEIAQRVTLRIYQWEQPTLSLGYFQAHAQRQAHPHSRDCPVVRRATGGGAIIHDREMTYSLTAPISDRLRHQGADWYRLVHRAWVNMLSQRGVQPRLQDQTNPALESEFLCFRRRAQGDLLLDDYKIGGSAQRRHRRAALQHGSLLLQRSAAAPELPGIAELAQADLGATAWRDDWIADLGRHLDVRWSPGQLDDQELHLARQLQRDKFDNAQWTLRR